jgi:hypothetical protein
MKTSVRKPSTREIGTVFAYWNRKKIVKHRVLTDRIRRKISGQLKYYTVAELCESIFNYSEVLLDDGCYWTYRWTLHDFLQRGVEKFMSEAVPFENFKSTYPISKPKPKVENKEYSNRFELWKNASPEEKKKLEKEWS